jgi:hypothetical protein
MRAVAGGETGFCSCVVSTNSSCGTQSTAGTCPDPCSMPSSCPVS